MADSKRQKDEELELTLAFNSEIEKQKAKIRNGEITPPVNTVDDPTAVDYVRNAGIGATNQFGLLPVVGGIRNVLLDPLLKNVPKLQDYTADNNIDLSDKGLLDRIKARFNYGYDTVKRGTRYAEQQTPKTYMASNVVGGLAIPAGGLAKPLTSTVAKGIEAGAKTTDKLLKTEKLSNLVNKAQNLKYSGLGKEAVDNAIEGGFGSYMFNDNPDDSLSSTAFGAGVGGAFPLGAKAFGKVIAPLGATLFGGANFANARKYIRDYPEMSKKSADAITKLDDIEKNIANKIDDINTTYATNLDNLSNDISKNSRKLSFKENKIAEDIYDDLVESYKDVYKKSQNASSEAYKTLRKDVKLDVSDLKRELQNVIEESKVNGNLVTTVKNPSNKNIKDLLDDMNKFAPDGKISEYDAKILLQEYFDPLSEWNSKAVEGWSKKHKAVAREMRGILDEKLKTSNPAYAKAMKPTAEYTDFVNNKAPELININDKNSALRDIKNLADYPELQGLIQQFEKYTGRKLTPKTKQLVNISSQFDPALRDKGRLEIVSLLTNPPEGLKNEQVMELLKRYDKINKTDFAKQYKKIRKEGKRDSIEAYNEIIKDTKLVTENKQGVTPLRRILSGYNPEPMTGKQSIGSMLSEGNEANPLNSKLLRNNLAEKTTKAISDITGENPEELEKLGRWLALDKLLDKSSTNGSRNVQLASQIGNVLGGGVLGGGLSYLYNSQKDFGENGQDFGEDSNKMITPKNSLWAGLGALAGGLRDYGMFNRAYKQAVQGWYNNPTVAKGLTDLAHSYAIRKGSFDAIDKNNKRVVDSELIKRGERVRGIFGQ